jgi:hypothetical protein
MALAAEVLPLIEKIRLLGAGKTPHQGISVVGGVEEMAGRADDLSLEAGRRSERKVRGRLGPHGIRTRCHEDRMEILLRFVAEHAKFGVVPPLAFELDRVPGVDTETGFLDVTEKTVAAVVRIGLLRLREGADRGNCNKDEDQNRQNVPRHAMPF